MQPGSHAAFFRPRVLILASCSACLQIVSKVGGGLKPTGAEGKPGLEVAYEDDHMACIIKPQVGGE
jgi:hypothetical protein